LIPLIAMGEIDGRFYREKKTLQLMVLLYIDPELPLDEFLSMVHGINEKIGLKTFDFSLKAYYNLAKEFLE